MFRRLLRQAPFFGYVFTVISPQTVGAQGHTPSRQRTSKESNAPTPRRTNGKHVGAYRIRPDVSEQARNATNQPHHEQTVNM